MTQPLPEDPLSSVQDLHDDQPSNDDLIQDSQKTSFYHLLDQIHSHQTFHPQKNPVLSGIPIDLYKLFTIVSSLGGYQKVCLNKDWKRIALKFQLPNLPISSAISFKHLYLRNLLAYEYVVTNKKSLEQVTGLSLDELEAVGTSIDNYVDTVTENGVTIIRSAKRPRFELPRPPVPPPHVTRFGANPAAVVTKFPVNPDDDGKDEKYVYGGWQNRLVLALKSHLPNEVDWAFNKLVRISYLHNFFVGFIPTLIEVLLEHTSSLFDKIDLNTSPTHFEATLKPSTSTSDVSPFSEFSVFHSEKAAILNEHVLQSLLIIRNLSFYPENQAAFAKDVDLLRTLAKAITLPSLSLYIEMKNYALDILENVIHLIPIRGQSDFYFAVIKVLLFDNDRSHITTSLRCLNRLACNERNAKLIQDLDVPVLQRLLQLLLIPDEEIVLHVMEFFYVFTQMTPDAGLRLVNCARFNVTRLLFKFLHWRGLNERKKGGAKSGVDPRAVEHYNAAMWLQTTFERDPGFAVTHDALNAAYKTHCAKQGLKSIPFNDLMKLTQKIFSASMGKSQTNGIKPRPGVNLTQGVVSLALANGTSASVLGTPRAIGNGLGNVHGNGHILNAKMTPRGNAPPVMTPFQILPGMKNKENEGPFSSAPSPLSSTQSASASHPTLNVLSSTSTSAVSSSIEFQMDAEQSNDSNPDAMQVDEQEISNEESSPSSEPPKSLLPYVCLWNGDLITHQNDYMSFETVNELVEYTKLSFIDTQQGGLTCQWNGCYRRGASATYETHAQLFSHVLTHISQKSNAPAVLKQLKEGLPSRPDSHVSSSTVSRPKKFATPALPMSSNGFNPADELRGIPLCALLVLRNVARHPANHGHFLTLESDLLGLMKNPKFNGVVGGILAELKY